jgi:hypothetical protein
MNEASLPTSCQRITHLTSCKQSIGEEDTPTCQTLLLRASRLVRTMCQTTTHLSTCEQIHREESIPTSTTSTRAPESTGHRNLRQQLHCPNCNNSYHPERQRAAPFVHSSPCTSDCGRNNLSTRPCDLASRSSSALRHAPAVRTRCE